MSNAVATQAAGLGGKYAWMNAANANSPAPKPKPAPAPAVTTTNTAVSTAITSAPSNAAASSWARPYVPTKKLVSAGGGEEDTRTMVTMRDALFVVEKERGHGGGRGAARGYT